MFAKLAYTVSTTTTATFAADILAVLTGTTSVSSLSANIDTGVSYINSAVSEAGWTLHDTITNGYVIKSPISDSPSKFKYVLIDYGTNAGLISFTLYEGWNSSTHVGTNPATDAGYEKKANHIIANGSSTMFVSASAKHVVIANNYNSDNNVSGPVLIAERTRASLWDTVTNDYTPAASIYFPYYFDSRSNTGTANTWMYGYPGTSRGTQLTRGSFECSTPDLNGGVNICVRVGKMVFPDFQAYNTILPASYQNSSLTANLVNNSWQSKIFDANKNQTFAVMPIETFSMYNNTYGGSVSQKSDIWVTNVLAGTTEDEIDYLGNRYVLIDVSSLSANTRISNFKIMVRKG